jgi:hypothetical protein
MNALSLSSAVISPRMLNIESEFDIMVLRSERLFFFPTRITILFTGETIIFTTSAILRKTSRVNI